MYRKNDTPTKGKRRSFILSDGVDFKKAWLTHYGDGDVGRENVYAKYSFNEGLTWSAPILLSKDSAGYPTAAYIVTKAAY